jgi:hypothetical protein
MSLDDTCIPYRSNHNKASKFQSLTAHRCLACKKQFCTAEERILHDSTHTHKSKSTATQANVEELLVEVYKGLKIIEEHNEDNNKELFLSVQQLINNNHIYLPQQHKSAILAMKIMNKALLQAYSNNKALNEQLTHIKFLTKQTATRMKSSEKIRNQENEEEPPSSGFKAKGKASRHAVDIEASHPQSIAESIHSYRYHRGLSAAAALNVATEDRVQQAKQRTRSNQRLAAAEEKKHRQRQEKHKIIQLVKQLSYHIPQDNNYLGQHEESAEKHVAAAPHCAASPLSAQIARAAQLRADYLAQNNDDNNFTVEISGKATMQPSNPLPSRSKKSSSSSRRIKSFAQFEAERKQNNRHFHYDD